MYASVSEAYSGANMKLPLIAILSAALLFLPGCGGGADVDGIKSDMRNSMEKLISVLDGIETSSDLDAATPRLKAIVAQHKKLKARMDDAFSGRSAAEREAATADMKNDDILATRFAEATLKATKVNGGLEAILPILLDFGK